MGVFIYNLDNEQKQANSKIEELNAEINNTQENVNNINTVVNETESVNEIKNSTEKDIKLDINSEQIQLLYKYIPAMNTNKIEVNAYQNKKVTKDSLSNKYLLGYAFSNFKLASSENESSEQTDVIDSKVDVKQIMQQENENTIKQTSDNLVSKYQNNMKEYKHIFKKDVNGNYYWYSTEPI